MIHKKVKISSEVLFQEVSGETVLLDLRSENYFGLDEVGTRFWQLLKEGNTLEKISDILLKEYDVSSEQLHIDLGNLISELEHAGLIEVLPSEKV